MADPFLADEVTARNADRGCGFYTYVRMSAKRGSSR